MDLRNGFDIKRYIRTIPDYPKPGIMFRDITTLLGNPRAFRRAVDELVHPYAGIGIGKVAGIEARGFILGGAMALVIRAELFKPGLQFVDPAFFNGMTTAHALLMIFGRHYAQPFDQVSELDAKRKWLGYLALLIFVLTFIPVPITIA